MKVLLVNPNRASPPMAPIGLECLAGALHAAGHDPVVLDLCFSASPEAIVGPGEAAPGTEGRAAHDGSFVDNARSLLNGGRVGFETKRGCPMECAYRADTSVRGHGGKPLPPAAVVEDLKTLLRRISGARPGPRGVDPSRDRWRPSFRCARRFP